MAQVAVLKPLANNAYGQVNESADQALLAQIESTQGARSLWADAAATLEDMGRNGSLEGAEETLTSLQREMARLMPVLADYVRQGNAGDKS